MWDFGKVILSDFLANGPIHWTKEDVLQQGLMKLLRRRFASSRSGA
jgi:hypothetical protein